jgi:hypothetical protein
MADKGLEDVAEGEFFLPSAVASAKKQIDNVATARIIIIITIDPTS